MGVILCEYDYFCYLMFLLEVIIVFDFFGINWIIYFFEMGGVNYMIDVLWFMFNVSDLDIFNELVGVIWIINGNNILLVNDDFMIMYNILFGNFWNDLLVVSVYYNVGEVYCYFFEIFNCNFINGMGGMVIFLINISEDDGFDMDNVFWNG